MPKFVRDVNDVAEEFESKGEADPIKASPLTLLGDGVIPQEVFNEVTGEFEVASFNFEILPTSPATMLVTINDGSALIKGAIIGRSSIKTNTVVATLTLDAADPTNPRLDMIVLKTDTDKFGQVRHRGNAKATDFVIEKGTPAASPVVTKDDKKLNKEGKIRIGTITVDAGATSILAGKIDNKKDKIARSEGKDIGCRIFNSAAISVPTGAQTALTFDSQRYDEGGLHSTTVNPSRITFSEAGKYLIVANVQFAFNAVNQRILLLRLNGTTLIAAVRNDAVLNGDVTDLIAVAEYEFAANDFVECVVFQNSGTALNVRSSAQVSPEFSARKIDMAG